MVRFAVREDLGRVNELREQVNRVHVEGKPEFFRDNFGEPLNKHIYEMWQQDNRDILVVERNHRICGFACVEYVYKPENLYQKARKYYHIDEFGVDEKMRRQGVGTELFHRIRLEAEKRGFTRIELDMWEFNETALKFYESIGFHTYRRYMEYEEES